MGLRQDILRRTGQIAKAHRRMAGKSTPSREAATAGLAADVVELVKVMRKVNGFEERLADALRDLPMPQKFA